MASRLAGVELGRDHVSWVLDGLGRYVVQDGEGGTAVYRVAHQSLADHLRPVYRRNGERPFDPAAELVWAALAERYATLIASGHAAAAPIYLWRYAYRHAAAVGVGVGGLIALRELASAADELKPDISAAALEVAEVLATWGQRAEAVAPTEEAVTLRRDQAADNPAYAPDLAMALNNLDRCAAIGDAARAEAAWQATLDEQDPPTRSMLLFYRADAADPGDPHAVAWLVEACRSDDRGVLRSAHDTARSHRAANSASWDAAWVQASGTEPPEWLTLDTDLLAVATEWINTPTYDDERDYLATHPELLDPDAGIAIEEALLRVNENATDRYRQLRVRARTEGVDAAYRPLLLILLADQFAAASPADQRDLLTERRSELLNDLVRDHLNSRAEETGAEARAAALLDIAARDADSSILTATFDALDDPARFPELLDTTTHDTITLVEPLATVALTAATTEPDAAVAGLYLAIAAAITGDQDRATDVIRQALMWDPGSASAWIARLARLGAVQPSVVPLITVLAEASHDDQH